MKIGDRGLLLLVFGAMLVALINMGLALGYWHDAHFGSGVVPKEPPELPLLDLELKLRPIAVDKHPPGLQDWLLNREEFGQSFVDYHSTSPVRKDAKRNVMYITLIGNFRPEQQAILERTREGMSIFFGVPVKLARTIALGDLPSRAFRVNASGIKQVLTGYVRDEVLKPHLPADSLASLAFTSADLTPGEGWNYVFGDASLQDRTGVWSIQRFGNPAADRASYQLCLKRTLRIATHETGHILSIHHCIDYECNMNGSKHLEESDRAPLHYCPVCTRKLCWNLGIEPIPWFEALGAFYKSLGFEEEAFWCDRASRTLKKPVRVIRLEIEAPRPSK